jgi:HSP20 family protein
MDRLSEAFDPGLSHTLPAGVFPLINLTEDGDNYYLRAELPGLKADALNIQADAKGLSISGERVIEAEGEAIKYHRKEREAGKFSRMIRLPGEVDSAKIDASLNDGILKIVIPKAEAVKPRRITIQ